VSDQLGSIAQLGHDVFNGARSSTHHSVIHNLDEKNEGYIAKVLRWGIEKGTRKSIVRMELKKGTRGCCIEWYTGKPTIW
jgi:hypothetical protein